MATERPQWVMLDTEVDVDLIDARGQAERLTLILVAEESADFDRGYLAASTPLGRTLLGQAAGVELPYVRGDIRSVRILAVRPTPGAAPTGAAERRRLAIEKARTAVERTNAEMFAASFSGKWGDYNTEHVALPGEEPPA